MDHHKLHGKVSWIIKILKNHVTDMSQFICVDRNGMRCVKDRK